MYLTRTFTFYLHKERLILLGRWPGMTNTSSLPSNQTYSLIDSRAIGSSVLSNHLSVSGPLMCPYTMLWNSAMTDSCTFLPPVSLNHAMAETCTELPVVSLNHNTSLPLLCPGSVSRVSGGVHGWGGGVPASNCPAQFSSACS